MNSANDTIQLNVLEFTKAELAAIPSAERNLLLLFGNMANELSVLNKLFYWSTFSVQADGVVGHAGIMQAQALGRMFAGKLLEAWEAIRKTYFGSWLSQKYTTLIGDNGRDALKACGRYFGSNNSIFHTRHNFGFHYSPDEIQNGFDQTSDQERFLIYFAEGRGNCLFYASEVVVGTANASVVGGGDVGAGIRGLLHDLTRVTANLQTFLDECINAIIYAHFGDAEDRFSTEAVQDVVGVDSVRVPFFVAPARLGGET